MREEEGMKRQLPVMPSLSVLVGMSDGAHPGLAPLPSPSSSFTQHITFDDELSRLSFRSKFFSPPGMGVEAWSRLSGSLEGMSS